MIRSKLLRFISAIPGKLSNRLVMGFLHILELAQKPIPAWYSNDLHNRDAMKRHTTDIQNSHGYIESQQLYRNVRYGRSTISYSGCEIIALYNALHALGVSDACSFPDLIRHFEKDGMLLSGRFGTAPRALYRFLIERGFHTIYTCRSDCFEMTAERSRVFMITMFNNCEDVMEQVHTICITKRADGGLIAHNVYGNGKVLGPYSDLSDLFAHLHCGKAKPICMIGIC